MSFSTEKDSALTILKAVDCDLAEIIDDRCSDYDDMYAMFVMLFNRHRCNPELIKDFVAEFDQTERENRGIYYNISTTPIADPKILVNCAVASVTFTTTAVSDIEHYQVIYVGQGSVIDKIEVDGGNTLHLLCVLPGGTVKILDGAADTTIEDVMIDGCDGAVGTVNVASDTTIIRNMQQRGGGYFGGYNCIDVTVTCAQEVTSVTATNKTQTSMVLDWTEPSESVRKIVMFRINNTEEWYKVNEDPNNKVIGNFRTDGSDGYLVRGLEPDTYYDFKIINVCDNGHSSPGAVVAGVNTNA